LIVGHHNLSHTNCVTLFICMSIFLFLVLVCVVQLEQIWAVRLFLNNDNFDACEIDLLSTDEPVTVFERLFSALIDPEIGGKHFRMFGEEVCFPANETLIVETVLELGTRVIKEYNIVTHPFSVGYHFKLFMRRLYKGLPIENEMGIIFGKFPTDKNIMGHNYVNIYHQYLQPYRDSAIRYLELGSLGGASLYAFREYFPFAEVLVGVDRNQVQLNEFDDKKLYTEVGDQTNKTFLQDLSSRLGPFDIMIDDCSHIAELTIKSFEILFPLLKDDGLYIIEDMSWSLNREALDYFFNLSRSLYRDRSSYGGDDITDPWKSAHKVSDPIEYSVDEVIFASSVVIIKKKIKHHWIV
jgi:hypothetical protein